MLVLTRRPEEGLVFTVPGSGERIVVTVLGVDGDKVKIGITAPRAVTVLRQELVEAVHNQNLAAARHGAVAGNVAPDVLRGLLVGAVPQDQPGGGA